MAVIAASGQQRDMNQNHRISRVLLLGGLVVCLLEVPVPFAAMPPGKSPTAGPQSKVEGEVAAGRFAGAEQFLDHEMLSGKPPAATCFEMGELYFER